jgi:hypothetical protein
MGYTDSELTEEKKLIWAGLKRAQQDQSAIVGEINRVENNVEWDTYVTHHDSYDLDGDGTDEDISNFSQFKTYLQDEHGFTAEEAQAYVDKIKNSFTDDNNSGSVFDEYEDYVKNTSTYDKLKNKFGTVTAMTTEQQTGSGEPVAGIRVHDTAGVSYDGVNVKAGTTEIFGTRVELSQQAPPRAEDGTISYANLSTSDSDNVVNRNQTITISADVTNSNSGNRQVTVTLTEDGSVHSEKTVDVDGGTTKTVSFNVTKTEYVCHDYAIADLSPITVCWKPSGLQLY